VATETAVIVEWFDLDPRLGLRRAAGWGPSVQQDILSEAEQKLERLLPVLRRLSESRIVALCPPTLPLPPIGHTVGSQASSLELHLRSLLDTSLCSASSTNLRVVSRCRLDELSPPSDRLDANLELAAGFPYRTAHADVLGRLLLELLFPSPPKKGLITDLDDTLWKGILGEVGVDGLVWDLHGHGQIHALYQQFLAALTERGVLIGIASKNDPSLVQQALLRKDLLLPASSVFPVEANWGAKSASVERILRAWNIAAESVVFIDDSPMEIAEVQARYPEMNCIRFPCEDPNKFWNLLYILRDLYGRPAVVEEDRLRTASLRAAQEMGSSPSTQTSLTFLQGLRATLTMDFRNNIQDARALELVNKTNQFNLNGQRYTHSEWRALLERNDAFLLTVSYEDKFGPLGKIAVVAGRQAGKALYVDTWVMSCRAFSRRIEHHTLDCLFAHFGVQELRIGYCTTERNEPLRDFLDEFVKTKSNVGKLRLTRNRFADCHPQLPHTVKEVRENPDE
jgi:FkbH-like protein